MIGPEMRLCRRKERSSATNVAEGRGAVGADDLGHDLGIMFEDLFGPGDFKEENGGASKHKRYAASEHDDQRQLALDGACEEPVTHLLTLLARRSSLELMISLA